MRLSRFFILFFFCSLLFIGLSQSFEKVKNRQDILRAYQKADQLYRDGEEIVNRKNYTEEKEEAINQQALSAFKELKKDLEKTDPDFDSLSFFINFKIGVLEHYFDNGPGAKLAYAKAISLKSKLPSLADSFLFKPYLYYGIILYNENLFDSSLSIYKKAEKIAQSYPAPLQETERLYNTLGALYYEVGNYKQAKNYTEKSLSVIPKSNPYYKQLVVNYKINLASILTRLEDFDEANRIYQEILPLNINRDIILHNTGVINLKLGAINKALDYFRRVNYTDNRKIKLYNDLAVAYMNIHQNDSAKVYLEKATLSDTSARSVAKGQTNQTTGDLLVSENKFKEALARYQQAMINYYPAYNENDIYKNPAAFSGVFSYINLFTTLTAKAETFESLYKVEKNISYLKAALEAYQSAFKLADYVEKSYDSDEARLFLNRIKYGVHSKPIDISLKLYEETKSKEYLEKTWEFDQMNKASILSFNIFENEQREMDSLQEDMSKEKAIRSAITRLSLKAIKENNADNLKTISNTIRDYEIELGRIQDKISANNKNKKVKPAIPSVKWMQSKLLDNSTAVLSYHLSENELLIYAFNKDIVEYKKIPISISFYSSIDTMIKALHSVTSENKYAAKAVSQRLYNWIIQPVAGIIKEHDRLIIIPDDELNYLPFEALQDAAGNYLIQNFSVQYQYSASLLEKRKRKLAQDGILSFAPFANATDDRLSYSSEEIKDLKGEKFIDEKATKENFLKNTNKFSVIHLATHAKANDNTPSQSYIAFANNNKDSTSGRLYAQEIYDLSLDSTRLVILSACETGTGQLVHGEGMMSLSRAFAYAGCPDIVTSLWKAEDKTTAFLTRRLHFYLDDKKTTDEALHLAKLDLLNSNEIDERLKTPNYWAHIIFIGEYESSSSSLFKWWLILPLLFIAAITGYFIWRKNVRN